MVNTYNSDVRTFAGNPIRLFLDNLLPVAICSFKSSVSAKNRSEVLFDLVNECNLSIAELMKLLSYSFENNFQVHYPLSFSLSPIHSRSCSHSTDLGWVGDVVSCRVVSCASSRTT
jgi:hypothetical protein